ncbi:fluoride efflux transporter CrcB [Sphingomonas koreensis]|nr:fluoride efflux transporter CrcB [Sphingomonas koreensis]
MPLLLVMLGGALGSGARYLVGKATLAWLGPNYPWGTLTVNLVGGLLMGLVIGILTRMSGGQDPVRLFVAVGALGGFTTFSSFALDAVNMIERGDVVTALVYALVSVIGAILGVLAGLHLMRALA